VWFLCGFFLHITKFNLCLKMSLYPDRPGQLDYTLRGRRGATLATSSAANSETLSLVAVVLGRGNTRVLAFADTVDDLRAMLGLPVDPPPEQLVLDVCVHVASVGLSCVLAPADVAETPREVIYVSLTRLFFTRNDTSLFTKYAFMLHRLQVDGGLADMKFPVLVAADSGVPDDIPLLNAALVLRKGEVGPGRAYVY
jgi:hypothetical protein